MSEKVKNAAPRCQRCQKYAAKSLGHGRRSRWCQNCHDDHALMKIQRVVQRLTLAHIDLCDLARCRTEPLELAQYNTACGQLAQLIHTIESLP